MTREEFKSKMDEVGPQDTPYRKPYDFSDSPFPLKFGIGDVVRFVAESGKEIEGTVIDTRADELLIDAESDKFHRQIKTACVLVRQIDTPIEERRAAFQKELDNLRRFTANARLADCISMKPNEEPMVMIPLEQYKQMLPVATQARYFYHRTATSDGQNYAETIGFQTHRELMEYMIRIEDNEERANKLCDLLGPRTDPDAPTIREV